MSKVTRISVVGALAFWFVGVAVATEQPKYEVLEQYGNVELRRYQPMLIAETWVDGSMSNASGRGFRILADFIFGNNTAAAGHSQEIAMTSPVTMQPQAEEIAMTAPVTMQQESGRWRVHFVMPSAYTYETLPQPNNPQVKVRQVPAIDYAVVSFSGFAGDKRTAQIAEALLAWMLENGLTPLANPEVARYDPPWRLPFMRRNEVMIAFERERQPEAEALAQIP